MNIALGLSIYNKTWLIEPDAALKLLSIWDDVRSGAVNWHQYRNEEAEPDKKSIHEKFFSKSNIKVAPTSTWELQRFEGFEGSKIALIPISGPLMKADFCGDFGTASMLKMHELAENTASVETIIYLIDSPGGTVDGTESFANAIASSKKNTISLVDNMMCSAAYWIGSSAQKIYATGKTNIIGSIGTMCSWYDYSEANKAKGLILREYYATASVDKNKMFSDANKGDGRVLVTEHLDPLNDEFLNAVRNNRKGLISEKDNVLTGKTYLAIKAIENGLIDGIKSLNEVISDAASASIHKTKQSTKMSKSNIAFIAVMAAIGADSISVVDGGFLLSEDQLNTLDTKLNENATVISTTASSLQVLKSEEEKYQTSAKIISDLEAENKKIKSKLDAASKEISRLSANKQNLDDAANSFFGKLPNSGNDAPESGASEEETQAFIDSLPHNVKAKEILGK